MKTIRVEYEIPPLRAIYTAEFEDDGMDNDTIIAALGQQEPLWRVRKIERVEDAEKPSCP